MLVNSIVDQYLNTQDTDLKYMTLRQDFKVENVEDLQLLVDNVLLPILLKEHNSEIVNLVSFEVFPNAVSKLVLNGSIMKKECERCWFDKIVVLPLIQKYSSNRMNSSGQTLRNILRAILDLNLGNIPICNEESSISALLQRMKNIKISHDIAANYVINWEILNLMIQLYYGSGLKMSKAVLSNILTLCDIERDLIEIMKMAVMNSIKVTERENLCDAEMMSLLQDKNILEAVSNVWYQLTFIATDIFEKIILPLLKNYENQRNDTILQVLHAAYNLHEFYSTERITNGKPLLEPTIIERLRDTVGCVKLESESRIAAQNNAHALPNSEAEMEIEEDPNQQAYLDELRDDSESLELEEVDVVVRQETSSSDNILNICETILSLCEPSTSISEATTGIAPHSQHIKLEEGSKPSHEASAFRAAADSIVASNSLSELQVAVEMLNQSSFTTEIVDFSQMCTLLLPHMRQNKNFFNTIKVGNMIQTIDEGLTLRAMVYSTLLQILTREESTHCIHYTVVCNLMKEAVHRGIRDSDPTIVGLSFKILQHLLFENYNKILGLDAIWYNETIYEKAISNIRKAYKRLESLSISTAADISNAFAVMQQFESLFLNDYPAMR